MPSRIKSEIRGPGLCGPMARAEYRALRRDDRLTLEREPTNRADENAVIAMTSLRQPCGYVAKEHAAIIAPEMDRGVTWRAVVTSQAHAMRCPQIVLHRDDVQAERVAERGRTAQQRFAEFQETLHFPRSRRV